VGTFDLTANSAKEVAFRSTPAAAVPSGSASSWRPRAGPGKAEMKYAVIVPLKGVGSAGIPPAMNTHMERGLPPTSP
jgi:hypothetical protein